MKSVKIFLIVFSTLLVWVVLIFFGVPVIPSIETQYFGEGSNIPMKSDYIVEENSAERLSLNIPDYFDDKQQGLDFWFQAVEGTHSLIIQEFSLTVKDLDGREQIPSNKYLFWTEGGEDYESSPRSFLIEKMGEPNQDRYVYIRSVFDLRSKSSFVVEIKARHSIDSVDKVINKIIIVNKVKKLTFHELRAH
jgi:hypothetical protein